MSFPDIASAAPNGNVIVTDVVVRSSDGGQATVGDTLTVKGEWDATNANPIPGDTFTIGLPPELGFEQAVPFNLDGPDPQENTVTWATCLTDPASGVATCTFSNEVESNSEFVKGTFEFDVVAEHATTSEDVIFDLNGTNTAVDLPGDGGIDDGVVLPDDWSKSGKMNDDKWSMKWTIELPGSRLAGHDVVHIFEELSDNHQLCSPSNLKIQTVRGSTTTDVTTIGATTTEVTDPYDFGITLTAPEAGFDTNVTYKITYDTCTPDGQIDPQGTVYNNTATVDVWGESSGVIGVTQDWSFSDLVSKQGSVLGGGDRNGKIQWTVTVAGDHLVGKNQFTLTESLTGEHQVCPTTISGIRVFERYGPSTSQQREITGELSTTTVASTSTSFDVNFSIASESDFVFRPSDHLYLIQYQTCSTTTGLPESGTVFGNQARVDGAITGDDATVPGRTDQKTGSVNSTSVTIDGVEYLPQTTLGWNITVPGQNLVNIDSPLTITDTLTASHQVCVGNGGSIASRLGLHVEARDQIQNGGLSTVDLSAGASATLNGNNITISIPQPSLPQPGGGNTTGFSREYQYVITYTTCTTSGGMDSPGTTYGNSATVAGKSYGDTVTQRNSGRGTGQGMPRGTVAIAKTLSDTPGAAFVPEDTTFTVHVKEIDPAGTTAVEYDLSVPLNGEPVSGLNARGNGWTIELSELSFPSVPGVTFGNPAFAAGNAVSVRDGGKVATAALLPATNIQVALENTAQLGSLEVVKRVDGAAASLVDTEQKYAMTASIDVSALGPDFPAQPERHFELVADAADPYVLDDLPVGATVTFSEQTPADDDILTWAEPTITPNQIEITAGYVTDPATITVTNHVERTVGTFSLAKEVTGAQSENPAVPQTVTVTASWTQNGEPDHTTLTLPTDGTSVPLGENLLIGTEVTLTETPLSDGSSIAWSAPIWSGTGVETEGLSAVVTVGRSADAHVTLTNHAATSTAGITLIKGIAGEAADEVNPDTTFPIHATWLDGEGVEQSKDLLINAVQPTPLGEDLPAGTVVTLTEGERSGPDTVVWDRIAIFGDTVDDAGDGSATVTISDQQGAATLVTVVNEATWAPGTFSVAKHIEGVLTGQPDVADTVTIQATWLDDGGVEQTKELTAPTDGTAVPFGDDLPYGTQVLLTESEPESAPSFTWAEPLWSGDSVEAQSGGVALVTIGAATTVEVQLTNTAVPLTGSLSLTKELAGGGASALPTGEKFSFTASWKDLLGQPQSTEVQVTAGNSVELNGLPLGTPVTLTESEGAYVGTIHWDSVEWSEDSESVSVTPSTSSATIVITGEQGTRAELTATNSFSIVPAGLAVTGAIVGPLMFLLPMALLAAAAWFIYRNRRRSEQE